MKKASARIRNKVKNRLIRSISQLEGLFGDQSKKRPDDRPQRSSKSK